MLLPMPPLPPPTAMIRRGRERGASPGGAGVRATAFTSLRSGPRVRPGSLRFLVPTVFTKPGLPGPECYWRITLHVQGELPVQFAPAPSRHAVPLQQPSVGEHVCPALWQLLVWQVPEVDPTGMLQAKPVQQSALAVARGALRLAGLGGLAETAVADVRAAVARGGAGGAVALAGRGGAAVRLARGHADRDLRARRADGARAALRVRRVTRRRRGPCRSPSRCTEHAAESGRCTGCRRSTDPRTRTDLAGRDAAPRSPV